MAVCFSKGRKLTSDTRRGLHQTRSIRIRRFASYDRKLLVTRMGESALTSHMKGAKHRELLATSTKSSLDSFVTVTNESAAVAVTGAEQPTELGTVATGDSSESLQAGPSSRAPSMQPIQGSNYTISIVAHNAHLKAETLWALNVVAKNQSFKSREGVSDCFVLCFQIVRLQSSFTVLSRKQICLVSFGVVSYVQSQLCDKVKKVNDHVVLFDESLNDVLQSKQMNVLKLWDGTNVCT